KSPYRPGGGFMNGYQGSLEKHLQQTLFSKRSSSETSLHNPLLGYGNNQRLYASTHSSPNPSYSSAHSSAYPPYGIQPTQKQHPLPPHQVTKPMAQNMWEKKDTSQLHPAIRQEYNSM